jgi:hypothetical protein
MMYHVQEWKWKYATPATRPPFKCHDLKLIERFPVKPRRDSFNQMPSCLHHFPLPRLLSICSPVTCIKPYKGKHVSLSCHHGYGAAARQHPDGVPATALYVCATSSRLRLGFPRLITLLPVVMFLAVVPLAFTLLCLPSGRHSLLRVALHVQGHAPHRGAWAAGPQPAHTPIRHKRGTPVKLMRHSGPSADETATSPCWRS